MDVRETRSKKTNSGGKRGSIQEGDLKMDLGEMLMGMQKELQRDLSEKFEKLNEKFDKIVVDIRELTAKTEGLEKKVKNLSGKASELERSQKEMKVDNEELRGKCEKVQSEVTETRDQMWDSLAVIEMNQKQSHLRVRGLLEKGKENLWEVIPAAIAELLEEEKEEIEEGIEKIYRIKSHYARQKNIPGDCIVIFRSKQLKDRVKNMHYEKGLVIFERRLRLFDEIPPRLLKKRTAYKPLTEGLRLTKTPYRWEFPEGVTFTYRGKKHKITTAFEAEFFLKKNGKDFLEVLNKEELEQSEEGED